VRRVLPRFAKSGFDFLWNAFAGAQTAMIRGGGLRRFQVE